MRNVFPALCLCLGLAVQGLAQPAEPPEAASTATTAPEPGWRTRLRAAASAVKAAEDADAEVRATLTQWRDDLRSAAIREAKSVEPDRGLFLYQLDPSATGAADRGSARSTIPSHKRGHWLKLDPLYPPKLPSRVVLLVHGLDEPGGIWTDLAPVLADNGYTAVRFDYRNDDSIRASAKELADAARTLRSLGVERADIVAHSMGGLVARDILTAPDAYACNARGHDDLPDIRCLVTLGTPNTGSDWANLAALSDLREHIARWMHEPDEPRHLLGFLIDGDGHAGDDLLPKSKYLEELNARGLPDGCRITSVVARMADITDEELTWLTGDTLLRRTIGKDEAERIAKAIKDAASWVGDGVVCVDSANSVCINDVVDVPANHRTMIRNFDSVVAVKRALGDPAPVPPAIPIVLDRLKD
jgi:pimeloyl-ACP methyl ester carboxylesterase